MAEKRNQDWVKQAACRGMDTNFFFPERGEICKTNNPIKAVCDRCPVRRECLEYALENEEPFGWWGGKSEIQLKNMRKMRKAS